MRKIGSRLAWAVIAVALVAVLIGSYALSAQNALLPSLFRKPVLPPAPIQSGPSDLTLTLTLDKTNYQAGGISTVTITLKNTGTQQVTIETPNQLSLQLTVFDSNMNQVGTWGTAFHKVQMLRPPGSAIITLAPGETYSWTFQWGLGVYASTGTVHYQDLPAGNYNAQSAVSLKLSGSGLRPDIGETTLTSDVVQFSVK